MGKWIAKFESKGFPQKLLKNQHLPWSLQWGFGVRLPQFLSTLLQSKVSPASIPTSTSSQVLSISLEMAVPEVDKRLLSELEEMGFSLAHATRALHFSGNSHLDAAVNWLFEHENDADIDQMPLVPVNIDIESLDSSQITERVKLKLLELRNKEHKKKEHEENKLLRAREKEKRREGKELLEVKRTREDNERIRFMAKRRAEGEQLKRDRERIRQKLQHDKAERRQKLGLPLENPPTVKHGTIPRLEKMDSFLDESVSAHVPATKAELMRDSLRSLKINHVDDGFAVRKALQTLMIYVKNVIKNPDEEKFRKIRLGNPAFQKRVGNLEEGIRFLELCGFERDDGDNFLLLPADKVDVALLVSAGTVLNSAITNPYFGLLSKGRIDID